MYDGVNGLCTYSMTAVFISLFLTRSNSTFFSDFRCEGYLKDYRQLSDLE